MTPDKDAEIARLREQLRLANIDAANLEAERNDLARKLGAEVATTQRMRAALKLAHDALVEYVPHPFTNDAMNIGTWPMIEMARKAFVAIDAALASGNGDGGGK